MQPRARPWCFDSPALHPPPLARPRTVVVPLHRRYGVEKPSVLVRVARKPLQMVRHHLNPLRGGGVLDPQLLRRVTATAFLHGAAFLVVLVALAVALAVARVGGRFAAAGAAAMQAACRKGGRMQEEGVPRMRT